MDTLRWEGEQLSLLDQTKLPLVTTYIPCKSWQDVRDAIARLAVRGAPAIGIAAAYGVVLGVKELQQHYDMAEADFFTDLAALCDGLDASRPTAVNLHWALARMQKQAHELAGEPVRYVYETLLSLAQTMYDEDIQINTSMAEYGADELAKQGRPLTILTHCNAGALATAGVGTALGVIRALHKRGLVKMVYADETRPLLQGARLTAYELMADHIPVTLITDNMAGWVMKTKGVDAVIVGADRITHNGDTANKIGTYSLSILAKHHGIPFYIAAPTSTFDISLSTGDEIPIEERNHDEVRTIQGVATALPTTPVFNPAFDVTPHEHIAAIFTEKGTVHHPDDASVAALFSH